MGGGRRLKEYNRDIQIIGVEPYLGHKIQGLKNMKEAMVPAIYEADRLDRILLAVQATELHDRALCDMGERQIRQQTVIGTDIVEFDAAFCRKPKRRKTVHHAFWVACGTGGVDDRCQLIGVGLALLRQWLVRGDQ